MNNIAILHAIGINEYEVGGEEFVANCILCGEERKNLQINFAKKVFHCWVCDSGGRLSKLIAEVRGVTQEEANKIFKLDEINVQFELDEIERILKEDVRKLYSFSRYKVQDRYKYWGRRGIKEKYVNSFNLGLDLFTNRLVVPVIVRGKCIALIRRALSNKQQPKYIYSKGFSKTKAVFGYDSVDITKDNIVISEGAIDTIKLRQLGFNSVGLLGINLHEEQLDIITQDFDKVILALDNDSAGQEAMGKIVKQLEPFASIFQLVYTEEDPGAIKNIDQIKRISPITLL